jgi:hypothetical protein
MSPRSRETGVHGFALLAAIGAGAALLSACGGKVVVDGSGAGGADATTASTGVATATAAATGAGGGGACAALLSDFQAKIAAAQTCNPSIEVAQCTGASTTLDPCDCLLVIALPGPAADAAMQAHDAWVAAGCGPFLCDHCPPDPQAGWHCDPITQGCVPS